ncbi:transmembrane protease serine 11D-like isoform X2 [Portunus trituberculatus]|uniref:transmembrane protease serine 11D-like isoform X2 n=1 Tax=Portunus trituberculatus TaxID=210409 RepID=UPI001E1D038E|nr:transmembrane protease serine 11D-like isoform X2 [Portunus trituberculatus]
MRPALLSLGVFLMCVLSGSEARGIAPLGQDLVMEPRDSKHVPRKADQKCVGRCAVESSMGSSYYSSGSYSFDDSSMGSSYYGSMVYDYDSSMGSSFYSSGSYSGDSSMGSSFYSSGSYSGDSSMGSSYYSSGSYSGDSSMGSSYYGSMVYDYDSSYGSSYYGSGSYSYSYGDSMGPSYYGSGSYSYGDSMVSSYYSGTYSYGDSMGPSNYGSGSYSYYSYDSSMGSSYYGSGSYSYGSSTGSSYGSSGSGVTEATEQPATTIPSEGSCKCGVRNEITRIVGGVEATVNELPWQVALVPKSSSKPFCGASIIASQWILTAAHCVNRYTANRANVVIGEHDWSITEDTPVTKIKAIKEVIIHDGYNDQTMNNDIALLKLETPIVFPTNNKVAPICLPSAGNLFESVSAIVSGWGTLTSGGSQPDILNHVTVQTMTNEECKNKNYSSDDITDNMICAGVSQGGKDSCQGDSGGPLVTDNATNSELIGIVSWGSGCAAEGYPGVYTRVTNYLPWIQEKTGNSWSTCQPLS